MKHTHTSKTNSLTLNQINNSGGKYKPNNKQGSDIFSKKPDQETTQTYTWILSHLEEDPNVSLPKQEVYDEYRAFCQANRFEPLCVADFGKAMKHALPCIKPRRLGQRGNSRYCYSGLRKKYRIEPPGLPDLSAVDSHHNNNTNNNNSNNNQGSSSPSKQSHNPSLRSSQSSHHQNQDHQCKTMSSASSSSSSSASSNGPTSAQSNGAPKHNNVMNLKLEPFVENCSAEGACCPTQPPSSNGNNCNLIHSDSSTHLQHYVDSMHSSPVHQQNHHNQQPQQRLMRPMAGYLSGNGSYHNGQPRYQHSHSATSFQDCLPRTGTPDDDDYRHNYHDLNRPMVGPAIIPFSQSLPAQLAQQAANGNESFISYQSQPVESQVNYSTTQHISNNNHQQPANKMSNGHNNSPSNQMIVPNCCANETTTTTTSLANNSISQPQPQSQEAPCQPLQHSNGTNGTNEINGTNGMNGMNGMNSMNGTNGTAANNQNRSPNSQQQQQLSPCQDQATPPTRDSNGVNNPAPTTTSPNNKYPTLAQLNLNFMNDPLNGFEMDFASPFQSPTSTPYPMICSSGGGNNYLTQDAQDYYGQTAAVAAGDCNLQYPDQ